MNQEIVIRNPISNNGVPIQQEDKLFLELDYQSMVTMMKVIKKTFRNRDHLAKLKAGGTQRIGPIPCNIKDLDRKIIPATRLSFNPRFKP